MKIVSSVGLVLFDPEGRILMLKELESKPHYGKVAGMLSVPIETIEEGEMVDQTLRRLVIEEIGEPIYSLLSYSKRLMITLNDNFTERMFVYVGLCHKSFVAHPNDTDVEYFGWMPPKAIMDLAPGQLRLEMEPILCSYFGR